MTEITTSEEARELWRGSGLDYSVLTDRNLRMLAMMIEHNFVKATVDGTFDNRSYLTIARQKGNRLYNMDSKEGAYAEILVDGPYFRDREGITFNRDGFIGFAGWASSNNVKPILSAFQEWVETLKKEATA